MTGEPFQGAEAADPAELIAQGHDLLAREHAALSAARLEEAAAIAAEKGALLQALEPALARVTERMASRLPPRRPAAGAWWDDGTAATREDLPALRQALAGLIAEGRRNERLIAAALVGVRAARRRLDALRAVRHGEVAYAADGSRIACRADAASRNGRA